MTDTLNGLIPFGALRSVAGPPPRILLIGPYDPMGGEYTFLAPPLGVWRLAGFLQQHDVLVEVFDPNGCVGSAEESLTSLMASSRWDVVGVSTTGMTLQYDLALAHLVKRQQPDARLVAGGMEATFEPESLLRLGPFDVVVLGEGEKPMLEIASRVRRHASLEEIRGTVWRGADGAVRRLAAQALTHEELRDSIAHIPYERMPFRQYWDRLEHRCRVGDLPVKAEREARLAEIRSVRLITLNYCPMRCTFCSSTNFLNAAQGSTARIARLDAAECLSMVERIVETQPAVRTIIFQDDIFVFKNDDRIAPLCDAIVEAKARGRIPAALEFISTNRIDAMTPAILRAMRRAGFRVLGFGVESFSLDILREFNKAQIHPFIETVLADALRVGITPFLDMILSSPRCRIVDIAENIREAFKWTVAGCEVGMYPYVIPFSGSVMASDPSLRPWTVYESREITGTSISWNQAAKILPRDTTARDAILEIESVFDASLDAMADVTPHLPSRVRSLLWMLSAGPILERYGCEVPGQDPVLKALARHLPPSAACVLEPAQVAARRVV